MRVWCHSLRQLLWYIERLKAIAREEVLRSHVLPEQLNRRAPELIATVVVQDDLCWEDPGRDRRLCGPWPAAIRRLQCWRPAAGQAQCCRREPDASGAGHAGLACLLLVRRQEGLGVGQRRRLAPAVEARRRRQRGGQAQSRRREADAPAGGVASSCTRASGWQLPPLPLSADPARVLRRESQLLRTAFAQHQQPGVHQVRARGAAGRLGVGRASRGHLCTRKDYGRVASVRDNGTLCEDPPLLHAVPEEERLAVRACGCKECSAEGLHRGCMVVRGDKVKERPALQALPEHRAVVPRMKDPVLGDVQKQHKTEGKLRQGAPPLMPLCRLLHR
mmetsp:Transcript_92010/g.286345  ORF Transcript_92010/g.286345 Transcript_92010/m.286345 type:complete len:333 (+) Transcript_92010:403-1401(+)